MPAVYTGPRLCAQRISDVADGGALGALAVPEEADEDAEDFVLAMGEMEVPLTHYRFTTSNAGG